LKKHRPTSHHAYLPISHGLCFTNQLASAKLKKQSSAKYNMLLGLSIRIVYAFTYVVAFLPKGIQKKIAWIIGRVASQYIQKKGVVQRNIQLCFPHLSPKEIKALIIKNGEHMGKSYIEWSKAWFWSDEKLKKHFPHRIEGLELLEKKDPRGVLLIMKHSLQFFVDGRILGLYKAFGIVARRIDYSQFFDKAYFNARVRSSRLGTAGPDQTLKMIRWLKNGETVSYAPDHDFGYENSVVCEFFGIPAASIRAPFKIQKATNCRICYINSYYDKDDILVLSIRELANLSKTNPVTFMQRINDEFTRDITKHPHEYLWIYNRFKSFCAGLQRPRYKPFARDDHYHRKRLCILQYRHGFDYARGRNPTGFITTSAWIVNQYSDKVLLLRHQQTGQLALIGSVNETIPNCMEVPWAALLQAREVTGLTKIRMLSTNIFDCDMQLIVEGSSKSPIQHCDMRFFMQIDRDPFHSKHGAYTLEWVNLSTLDNRQLGRSIMRLVEKTLKYKEAKLKSRVT
jgi:KDO2-lipid IV(A) lauroyltransferase